MKSVQLMTVIDYNDVSLITYSNIYSIYQEPKKHTTN